MYRIEREGKGLAGVWLYIDKDAGVRNLRVIKDKDLTIGILKWDAVEAVVGHPEGHRQG